MSANGHHTAAEIRSRLDRPVMDGDGQWVEFDPVFSERLRKVGGDKAAEGFLAAMKTTTDALSMTVAERRRRRVAQPGFWTRQASNTLDRATAMMPRLLYERLDEIGSDFAIIYPTAGLRVPRIGDDATRRASRSGTTCLRSIATTTTTRSGRSAGRSASPRPSTARAAIRVCGIRHRTSSTTISGISRPPATQSPRRSSWVA